MSPPRLVSTRSDPIRLPSLRQFGVLVTTSYLASQAYRELRADGHPVIVMSGVDIVRVLQREKGIRTPAQVKAWVDRILA